MSEPTISVDHALISQGYSVVVVEPNIESHVRFPLVTLADALKSADVLVVLVKHRGFLDDAVKTALSERSALDLCGVLND